MYLYYYTHKNKQYYQTNCSVCIYLPNLVLHLVRWINMKYRKIENKLMESLQLAVSMLVPKKNTLLQGNSFLGNTTATTYIQNKTFLFVFGWQHLFNVTFQMRIVLCLLNLKRSLLYRIFLHSQMVFVFSLMKSFSLKSKERKKHERNDNNERRKYSDCSHENKKKSF